MIHVPFGPPAAPGPAARRGTRIRKTKPKRTKQMESSDSTASQCRRQLPRLSQGPNVTSWSASDTSQSAFPLAYPSVIPGFPLQVYSGTGSAAPGGAAAVPGCSTDQGSQAMGGPSSMHPPPYCTPVVTPVVALVLPNYLYPPLAGGMMPPQPLYPPDAPGFPTQLHPFSPSAFSGQFPLGAAPPLNVQNQFGSQHHFPSQAGSLTPCVYFPPSTEAPKAPTESPSRSTTPQYGGCGGPASPPIFHSSCSSPLNLLELELSVDRQDGAAPPPAGQGNNAAERESGAGGIQPKDRELKQVTTVSLVQLPPANISYLKLSHLERLYFSWFDLSG